MAFLVKTRRASRCDVRDQGVAVAGRTRAQPLTYGSVLACQHLHDASDKHAEGGRLLDERPRRKFMRDLRARISREDDKRDLRQARFPQQRLAGSALEHDLQEHAVRAIRCHGAQGCFFRRERPDDFGAPRPERDTEFLADIRVWFGQKQPYPAQVSLAAGRAL